MAGGPFFPSSQVYDGSANVFPNVFVGDGANAHRTEGCGVVASLAANAEVDLEFWMPPGSLPSGTPKLRLIALADAVTGDAKVTPSWASVAIEEDPSAATLNSEGTSTLTWGANDDDEYKELKITLDADTVVAGECIVMHLQFTTASWTLAQVSNWIISVVFED
jgi:hypothetical protein